MSRWSAGRHGGSVRRRADRSRLRAAGDPVPGPGQPPDGPAQGGDQRDQRGQDTEDRDRSAAAQGAEQYPGQEARELEIPANQASFHLRQLAKYGLVEEDPAAARDKRDRVWKLVSQEGWTANLGELEDAPGGKSAVQVFRRSAAAWGHVVVDAAYATPSGSAKEKDTIRTVSEEAVRLTKEEAEELSRDLEAVVGSWVERTRGRDDVDRRTYLLFSVLQPHPDR